MKSAKELEKCSTCSRNALEQFAVRMIGLLSDIQGTAVKLNLLSSCVEDNEHDMRMFRAAADEFSQLAKLLEGMEIEERQPPGLQHNEESGA